MQTPCLRLLALGLTLLGGCAAPGGSPAAGPGGPSPRMHHLLDLEDARVPPRELEPFLRDPDAAVRARAALAVSRLSGTDVGALLRLASHDGDPSVRAAAALGIGLTGDATLAGDALSMLRRAGAGSEERAAAASAVVRLAGERAHKEEPFAAPFSDADPLVRRAAFRALVAAVRTWEEKPSPLPPWLVEGLFATDPQVRACAAAALRTTGYKWEPRLTKEFLPDDRVGPRLAEIIVGDIDPDVRAAAALALRGTPEQLDALLIPRLLKDEDLPRVRVNIARALGRNPTTESRRALMHILAHDPDFHPRAAAAAALGAHPRDDASEMALEQAAWSDASTFVRAEALGALHALGGPVAARTMEHLARASDSFLRAASAGDAASMDLLRQLARDPEVLVRESAVSAAGARGRDGLDLCLAALDDPDPVVAAIAASALGTMGASEAMLALERAFHRYPAPQTAPDDGADLRAGALEALGAIGAPSARALADRALGDPDPSVRAAAVAVLTPEGGAAPATPVPPRLEPFPDARALLVDDAAAPRVVVRTNRGSFTVRLFPSAAPIHVSRFLRRVRDGGYDGTVWHRIVSNFVAQGGDPRGDGSGNGGSSVRQEFSAIPYRRGTLGVPRSTPPDSGGCQLFFCHGETPHLDQRYTVIGAIDEGFEVLDRLDLGDRIVSIRVR